ncbi:hypothetical protein RSSM_05677 [Rhodopirellula sallentina SM41]|uniref:Uncharacterized protein n=1 Tax=Rhodopirellula sallentina SM41 TaxID=1263870 RepID=M5UA23_9BACT|nr:hypothetical protein RSSM_05677 [Rhodopirellula sallentina SM41]
MTTGGGVGEDGSVIVIGGLVGRLVIQRTYAGVENDATAGVWFSVTLSV